MEQDHQDSQLEDGYSLVPHIDTVITLDENQTVGKLDDNSQNDPDELREVGSDQTALMAVCNHSPPHDGEALPKTPLRSEQDLLRRISYLEKTLDASKVAIDSLANLVVLYRVTFGRLEQDAEYVEEKKGEQNPDFSRSGTPISCGGAEVYPTTHRCVPSETLSQRSGSPCRTDRYPSSPTPEPPVRSQESLSPRPEEAEIDRSPSFKSTRSQDARETAPLGRPEVEAVYFGRHSHEEPLDAELEEEHSSYGSRHSQSRGSNYTFREFSWESRPVSHSKRPIHTPKYHGAPPRPWKAPGTYTFDKSWHGRPTGQVRNAFGHGHPLWRAPAVKNLYLGHRVKNKRTPSFESNETRTGFRLDHPPVGYGGAAPNFPHEYSQHHTTTRSNFCSNDFVPTEAALRTGVCPPERVNIHSRVQGRTSPVNNRFHGRMYGEAAFKLKGLNPNKRVSELQQRISYDVPYWKRELEQGHAPHWLTEYGNDAPPYYNRYKRKL